MMGNVISDLHQIRYFVVNLPRMPVVVVKALASTISLAVVVGWGPMLSAIGVLLLCLPIEVGCALYLKPLYLWRMSLRDALAKLIANLISSAKGIKANHLEPHALNSISKIRTEELAAIRLNLVVKGVLTLLTAAKSPPHSNSKPNR